MARRTSSNRKSESSPYLAILLGLLTIAAVFSIIYLYGGQIQNPEFNTTLTTSSVATTTVAANGTTTAQTTTMQTTVRGSQLDNYALGLINADRQQFGLTPVTLSSETSGQQHAQSMLESNYFSHWDIYGMKPYMRYTLLGGRQAVSENVAYKYSSICTLGICSGNIDPQTAITQMEHDMMYNDSQCCGNGHRDNILNANHNQVSIGVAYNSSNVYFTEDFIDNYVNWNAASPNYSGDEVSLSGTTLSGFDIDSVQVTYDPTVMNMTQAELKATGSYGYGTTVAGVVGNPLYYYQGIITIAADKYSVSGSQFNISFSLQKAISQYGAGEYTIMTWLNSTSGQSFVGATYTIFIGSNGQQYVPQNV